MAQILVRRLEERVKARLQIRARRAGRSVEEEVREILRAATKPGSRNRGALGTRIARRFSGLGLRAPIPELQGQPPRPAGFEP